MVNRFQTTSKKHQRSSEKIQSLFFRRLHPMQNPSIPQDWNVYFSRIGDAPAALRINLALIEVAPLAEYPQHVRVSMKLEQTNEHVFPLGCKPCRHHARRTDRTRLCPPYGLAKRHRDTRTMPLNHRSSEREH